MSDRPIIPTIALLLLGACSLAAEPRAKPNIVLIYGDDIGYGDFSCYGATAVKTPNVDRLATDGVRFTSAYATSATCTPSRFSLLTGEYAWRQKGTGILAGDARLIIKPGRQTLAGVLQRAGYKTAVVGKWHLGLGAGAEPVDWNAPIQPGPLEVGFDYSFIMAATGDRVPCVYIENRSVVGLDVNDPIEVDYQKPFPGEPTGVKDRDTLTMNWSHGHNAAVVNGIGRIGFMKGGKSARWRDDEMATVFTKKAVEFIEHEKERPFFLYFATHDIHVPRVPNREFVGQTTMGARGDAIVEFDWSVGQIVATLERLKLLDNTLIIISSDNGPVLDDGYQDGAVAKLGAHKPAGPWRGGKYSLFEGGTRMPFITYWRSKINPGISDALISQVDLLASCAALTEQKFNDVESPDSQNVLLALLGKSAQGRESVVAHAGGIALRQGDWKFIPPGRTRDQLGPGVNVKIAEPGLLFDLANDPGETNNLADKQPEKLQELHSNLQKLRSQSVTP
jgi:arylsulfatase A-like enzyme